MRTVEAGGGGAPPSPLSPPPRAAGSAVYAAYALRCTTIALVYARRTHLAHGRAVRHEDGHEANVRAAVIVHLGDGARPAMPSRCGASTMLRPLRLTRRRLGGSEGGLRAVAWARRTRRASE